ncbi:hypothetical protein EDD16DRAFT_558177 [Pisolithus croceorrhizus]|nr:hypothetical protein EDD16DRAFT_558177 [Pisolithus croceorrhizus]KAI6105313.1 hypothetical protein EV401DRAFT_596444 [Pisolithus croceorrhizus]KAI6134578.1 hypothetical protein EDD17DRAFT_534426 [Pisolithus thermaeus]
MAHSQPKPIDTKRWKKDDRDVKINKFIVTAVVMPEQFKPDDPTKQLIHWRGGGAYRRGEDWFSTSFDTRKLSATDPAIEVQLISKPFMVSSVAPYYWECLLSREYTTTEVYHLLVAKKFNHYRYNGAGSGCLTWTTRLVKVLEEERVLPAGSMQSFLAKVQEVRADPHYWVPYEPGAHFY